MTDLIGHIDTLFTMTKAALDIRKDFNDAVYKKQIADIIHEFAEFKTKAAELETAYAALLEENRELKSQHQEDIDNPLTIPYPGGIYFDTRNYPYCVACKDGPTQRRIHLVKEWENNIEVCYVCKTCNQKYNIKIGPAPRGQPAGWDPLDY